jgi:hypothetical protein
MSFLLQVKNRYKVVCDALGFINKKELQEKMPELAKAYEETFGAKVEPFTKKGKRPDIKIVASDTFSFPHEKYTLGSWHIIYAYLNGDIKKLPVEQFFGKEQKLVPNSMILDCIVGNYAACYLYVHPSDATPLLKESGDLSDEEYIALHCLVSLKPMGREREFYYIKYKLKDTDARSKNPNEYADALKSLAAKGLVKINSAGSAQITLEGKNRAIKARDIINKY